MSIEIYEGSILDCDVDAIVNPANGFLNHGAGLARIIADAAAPYRFHKWAERADADSEPRRDVAWGQEQRKVPTIATGSVAVTSAGRLPYKGIIHAVGPVWEGGDFYERQLLASAHAEACAAAWERGWKSIAFPAISCGLFRFPVEIAAPLALDAVQGFASMEPDRFHVTFALMEPEHIAAYRAAL